MATEHVVLVDENDHVLGTAPKATVHEKTTPLHRGFSLFIFSPRGELLLQQRALTKVTWPGVWSNSCCGHPALEEKNVEAAKRRAHDELGLTLTEIIEMSPYRYRFTRAGVQENEICPILVAATAQTPNINPQEVAAIRWIAWGKFVEEISTTPGRYSEWCEEEVLILQHSKKFQDWYGKIG
ncbi:MAG: isopentenyl-diphosphate Delta-isomerase [Patescibacteria group bacterium]|nr:isopentenyl-diphosphate Delta-isomerase [Patescibacteria group bacterium]